MRLTSPNCDLSYLSLSTFILYRLSPCLPSFKPLGLDLSVNRTIGHEQRGAWLFLFCLFACRINRKQTNKQANNTIEDNNEKTWNSPVQGQATDMHHITGKRLGNVWGWDEQLPLAENWGEWSPSSHHHRNGEKESLKRLQKVSPSILLPQTKVSCTYSIAERCFEQSTTDTRARQARAVPWCPWHLSCCKCSPSFLVWSPWFTPGGTSHTGKRQYTAAFPAPPPLAKSSEPTRFPTWKVLSDLTSCNSKRLRPSKEIKCSTARQGANLKANLSEQLEKMGHNSISHRTCRITLSYEIWHVLRNVFCLVFKNSIFHTFILPEDEKDAVLYMSFG